MKTWERARHELHCGMCRGVIAAGSPVLLLQLPGLRYQPKRCGACAQRLGESMPADIPRTVPPASVPKSAGTPKNPNDFAPIAEIASKVASTLPAAESPKRPPKKPPPAFKRKAHAR